MSGSAHLRNSLSGGIPNPSRTHFTPGGVCIVGNDDYALYALSSADFSLQALEATGGIVCSSPAISYAADLLATPNYGWEAGVYHVHGQDGWDGTTGFYGIDHRALLTTVGETKTWLIYFWGLPGVTPRDLVVQWCRGSSWEPWPSWPASILAELECVQFPQGMSAGPQLGTVWTSPPENISLPFYSTSSPAWSGSGR